MLKTFTLSTTGFLFLLLLLLYNPLPSQAQLAKGKPTFAGNVIDRFVPGIFTTYWNQVTPGNAGKRGSVEGTTNVMNWADLDLVYHYAASKNMPFKAHTLVRGMQDPGWISSLPPADQAALKWQKKEYFNANDGTTAEVLAEAEPGLLGGTSVANTRAGFSATSYATGFDASGDFVEGNVNLAAAGTFPLVIRYGTDAATVLFVKVNGSLVKKNLSLSASGSFTNLQV